MEKPVEPLRGEKLVQNRRKIIPLSCAIEVDDKIVSLCNCSGKEA